jgi:hypothetical protein
VAATARDRFKPRGLHDTHAVAVWKLGLISIFAWRQKAVAEPSEYLLTYDQQSQKNVNSRKVSLTCVVVLSMSKTECIGYEMNKRNTSAIGFINE